MQVLVTPRRASPTTSKVTLQLDIARTSVCLNVKTVPDVPYTLLETDTTQIYGLLLKVSSRSFQQMFLEHTPSFNKPSYPTQHLLNNTDTPTHTTFAQTGDYSSMTLYSGAGSLTLTPALAAPLPDSVGDVRWAAIKSLFA